VSIFALYQEQSRGLAYVGLAILLGAIIGFEREVEGKPAGLRTHMLVAGAGTTIAQFTLLSEKGARCN
jgi:putative Mg2+ transporter-C (MgtC) family protein